MSTLNTAVNVAASALSAERTRIEVAVSNLANAESTRGADGKPYRRRDVVLTTDTIQSFDSALGSASATGVKVAGIVEDTAPARRRYDPSHPDADRAGFVELPNINPAEEMVDKSKNPADLTDKVHKIGRTVGRTELDVEDDSGAAGKEAAKPKA